MNAYNPEFIPKTRNPAYSSYDNKPLKKWSCDDFAEYIFDNSTFGGTFNPEGTFLDTDTYMEEYLEDLPKIKSQRVFLYGVFEMLKARIRLFKRSKIDSKIMITEL